jgi:hypothetical protein
MTARVARAAHRQGATCIFGPFTGEGFARRPPARVTMIAVVRHIAHNKCTT